MFVVTGAAGSIVAAITADLAAAYRGTFHLLDLTPEPDPADPDLRRYTEDRDGFKTEIADRMRQRGERPTPVLIERELARFERLQAALAAVQAVETAGGTAHYHSVDLTDADAVARRRSHRSATPAGASTSSCTRPASRSATRCPTSSPANSTSCSTSKATGSSTCCTPPATWRWAPSSRSARWRAVRQRRADRLQRRQRPAG